MEKASEASQAWRGGDSGVKYMFRGPRLDWGLVKLKPGQELGAHYHKAVEETFYFPHGACRMTVAANDVRVKPGDAFRVEPGEAHNIINDTDSDVTAIFIKCPYDPDDKVAVK